MRELKVSTDIVDWYPETSKIHSDYSSIRKTLSGITPLSIFIESTNDRSVTETDVVATLQALTSALEERPEVGKAIGINHPLRSMHGRLQRRQIRSPSDIG